MGKVISPPPPKEKNLEDFLPRPSVNSGCHYC